jgi:hypothetical protein
MSEEKVLFRRSLIFSGLTGTIVSVLASCAGSPARPDMSDKKELAVPSWPTSPNNVVDVALAAVEMARGGIYVYLIVHGPEAEATAVARDLGNTISTAPDPSRFFEMRSSTGSMVNIKPMRQPKALLPSADPAPPPGRMLARTESKIRYLQAVMLRTEENVAGRYDVRLISPWSQTDDLVIVDESWQTVDLMDQRRR